jgi:hypothetical protein
MIEWPDIRMPAYRCLRIQLCHVIAVDEKIKITGKNRIGIVFPCVDAPFDARDIFNGSNM